MLRSSLKAANITFQLAKLFPQEAPAGWEQNKEYSLREDRSKMSGTMGLGPSVFIEIEFIQAFARSAAISLSMAMLAVLAAQPVTQIQTGPT